MKVCERGSRMNHNTKGEHFMKISKKLVTMATTAMMIVAMSSVVIAATTYTKTGTITVTNDNGWISGGVEFTKKSSHTASIDVSKVSHKGDCWVDIVGSKVLGHRISYASYDFPITTGSVGLRYSVTWSSVSAGTRYYSITGKNNISCVLSRFSDTWSYNKQL